MTEKYGFSGEELKSIRNRDKTCVYCHKPMIYPSLGSNRRDWATVEHLRETKPFYKKEGLKVGGLVMCCQSCNSSRGVKKLSDWFKSPYCLEKNINKKTVAKIVRKYIENN